MNRKAGIGSTLDDFLKAEGILQEVNTAARKRVLAWYRSRHRAPAETLQETGGMDAKMPED